MCCFFRHIVFVIESLPSLIYIGVWNKQKKKEPNSPAGSFFL